jgi:pyruvate kinase
MAKVKCIPIKGEDMKDFEEYWNKYGELHASFCKGDIKLFASEIWKSAKGYQPEQEEGEQITLENNKSGIYLMTKQGVKDNSDIQQEVTPAPAEWESRKRVNALNSYNHISEVTLYDLRDLKITIHNNADGIQLALDKIKELTDRIKNLEAGKREYK